MKHVEGKSPIHQFARAEEPRLLDVQHHSNFISEYQFDPIQLNLGFFVEFFEHLESSDAYRYRNDQIVKDTQIYVNEVLASGIRKNMFDPIGYAYPEVDSYGFDCMTDVFRAWNITSRIAIDNYIRKYETLGLKQMDSKVAKLQRTKPSEGFHNWHADHGSNAPYRQLVTILYLNDDFEGGETEFLYQSVRVKPKIGKYVIFPAAWTHTHRGNPPIGGTKYICTSWVDEYPMHGTK
tara:strand:+ start:553 stop:1260 length:708 start_codon:yes stop_codon:yes gene_type:complete